MSTTSQGLPLTIVPIGHVSTGHLDARRIPPQATYAPADIARITVRAGFVDGLLGLDRYRHLWLITWLHRSDSRDTAPLRVVPRAAEAAGEVQGVFASRAPTRPNPIGLSLVRHLGTDGDVITVAGVDLLDGTPVLDVKPWFRDCDDPRSFETSTWLSSP